MDNETTTPEAPDACRSKFEAEILRLRPRAKIERKGKTYIDSYAQFHWEMWQAAWSARKPEGEAA